MIQLQTQQFINSTLHEPKCSRNCWCSQKLFLKISQISGISVGSTEFLKIPFFFFYIRHI